MSNSVCKLLLKILEKEHKKAGVQLYERLAKYFKILETNKYVVFVNEEDK